MILLLQQWIYQQLNQPLVSKQVKGIYYQVPVNSNFPYIHIGDFHSKDISTKDKEIAKIYFKLVIYTRDKSLISMLELGSQLIKILKANHTMLISCLEEKINQQNDGVTQQISMTFKAIIIGKIDDI